MMQVTNRISPNEYIFKNTLATENKVMAEHQVSKQKPKKVGFGRGLGAYMAGAATSFGIGLAYDKTISDNIIKQMNKLSKTDISKEINQGFENSNLKSVGAEIVDISKLADPKAEIAECLRKSANKTFRGKLYNKTKFGRVYLERTAIRPWAQMLVSGENAAALFNTNKIILDTEKIGTAAFHEMGHLMNRNFSKIGKILQRIKSPFTMLAGILSTIALLTNKRTEANPPKNAWQKTTTFIKENVGKLVAICFVPTIAEEAMASVRGQKLAKSILSKDLMKNVSKHHVLGLASYVGVAIATGVSAFAANKVRDRVAHGKNV